MAPSASMRSGAAPPVYTGPGATAFTRTPLGLNERGEPGVVDQDINIADIFDQALEVGWIAEVGADEACPASRSGNRSDGLGGARR